MASAPYWLSNSKTMEKTLSQLKLDTIKIKKSGPYSLNLDYYIMKNFEKREYVDSQLQQFETGEPPRDWNL